MGILDGLFDTGSSWPGIIKGAVDVGGNLFNSYNKQNAGNSYVDALRNSENQTFTDTNAYNNAYAKYLQGASAASGAASRARAGAAAATERNRQAAAQKAQKFLTKVYKQTMGMYAPFKDTATQLLPEMQHTYESGLNTNAILDAYLKRPENMALLNGSTPAASSGPMLPDYLKR